MCPVSARNVLVLAIMFVLSRMRLLEPGLNDAGLYHGAEDASGRKSALALACDGLF